MISWYYLSQFKLPVFLSLVVQWEKILKWKILVFLFVPAYHPPIHILCFISLLYVYAHTELWLQVVIPGCRERSHERLTLGILKNCVITLKDICQSGRLMHLLLFSGRGYLILVVAGQENWPPVPNFMWNFSPDRGSDPARRIQVRVKSYLTWWWMAGYLGVRICPDTVGAWGWGSYVLLHCTPASGWQKWHFQNFSWFPMEMMGSPIVLIK